MFFTSSRSVKAFVEAGHDSGALKLAALGSATAEAVRSKFGRVDFVGSQTDTTEVARAFEEVSAGSRVFFPISDRSVRRVQSQLNTDTFVEAVAYKTVFRRVDLDWSSFDVMVFSSPSNVESFQANSGRFTPSIIAFGETTKTALAKAGVERVITPKSLNLCDLHRSIHQFVE